MSKLKDLIESGARDAEEAEGLGNAEEPLPAHVKVTRGHPRAKTLQIRLRDDELAELEAVATHGGLPVSTVARQLLLQALAPDDDLPGALDRLERDLSVVRRKALST